eukprot:TRINITY_DN867_c0_g1_i1.p1 TRINITY_DN867_c0_g1~~TRINITY_DN867_c0_g1_i1.p1  ORF type:complete len:363 (-),score=109.56 TRINITY_DN867_c0_g1_i1:40-1128(-)
MDNNEALESDSVVELKTEKNIWTFSKYGARLINWKSYDKSTDEWRYISRGDYSKLASKDHHQGVILFPWVNRLGGEEWKLQKPDEEDSLVVPVAEKYIHGGHITDHLWDHINDEENSNNNDEENNYKKVKFQYILEKNIEAGYPTKYKCSVTYEVTNGDTAIVFINKNEELEELDNEEGLKLTIEVTNLEEEGGNVGYIGVGFHPYFCNPFKSGQGSINEVSLTLRSETEICVDDNLIPTGQSTFPSPNHDFDMSDPRLINIASFDTAFIVDDECDVSASLRYKNYVLAVHLPEIKISNNQSVKNKYMQVYIPKTRDSIAFEPQSAIADAYNHPFNDMYGNIILKPTESLTFSSKFIVSFDV